jgi:hypothetical protein
MPSKKHKPGEIIGELREVEIMLGQGGATAEVRIPRFIIQLEGELPVFIRRLGRPRQQHIRVASASQAMCEDGSRYTRAAKRRSSPWRPPATGASEH